MNVRFNGNCSRLLQRWWSGFKLNRKSHDNKITVTEIQKLSMMSNEGTYERMNDDGK